MISVICTVSWEKYWCITTHAIYLHYLFSLLYMNAIWTLLSEMKDLQFSDKLFLMLAPVEIFGWTVHWSLLKVTHVLFSLSLKLGNIGISDTLILNVKIVYLLVLDHAVNINLSYKLSHERAIWDHLPFAPSSDGRSGWASLVLFTMLSGQASCRVATGQMLRVFVSLLSPSKRKSFASLAGRSLLCGQFLSAAVGSRTACTFLFLIWAVGGVFFWSPSCGSLLGSREWRFVPAVSISFPLLLGSSRRCLLCRRSTPFLPAAGWVGGRSCRGFPISEASAAPSLRVVLPLIA
jgi:hypothetical protein